LPLVFIPECIRDQLGQTPLHIAAAVGCHVSIIHHLLDGAMCVFVMDYEGRCPLHWACDNPNGSERILLPTPKWEASAAATATSRMMCSSTLWCFLSQATESSSSTEVTVAADLENMMHVIGALLNAYPEGVNIPSCNGMTPIDLAHEANACPMLIQMLEETAKLYPKNRLTTWEELEDWMTTSSHQMQLNVTTTTTMEHGDSGDEYDSEDDVSSLRWDGNFHTCGANFDSDCISL